MNARIAATLGLSLAALLGGCASPGTHAVGRAFYAGDFASAEEKAKAQLADDPDGEALCLDELGVLSLNRRALKEALDRFTRAWQIMNAITATSAQDVGAIVGSEASKIWRGDPHERAMNSYYLGITNLLLRIDDNGLAGFKNAIFVDSGQGDEKYDCDFAPAFFLEGIAYRRLAEPDMAERDFVRARELVPGCPAFDAANQGNVIVVVDVGHGPTKASAGENGEKTHFLGYPDVPASIDVIADGARLGGAAKAGDVYFQATTRGGREFDSILAGKSAAKTGSKLAGIGLLAASDNLPKNRQAGAMAVGAALLLTSLAIRAEADVRYWTTLPNEVQLFRGTLPPGVHQVEIRPSPGWRVAGPTVETIEVPEHGDVLVYQRVLR